MTPEQQRIAIAEACGKHTWAGDPQDRDCFICGGKPPADVHCIPDYLNDLNAMHEAEKHINLNLCDDYTKTLFQIVQDPHICHTAHHMAYVCASAAQRAEAFLRTVGIWKE